LIRTQLDAPIVLAHGLFGFRRIGLGRLTLTSYFRGIPESLREAGNTVVVTRVPSIAGVRERTRVLAREIDRALPGRPFHLIGHSMGGLDARLLLNEPGWEGRVLSLTTVGTPHLGSALADCARFRFGKVYELLRAMRIDARGFLDITRRAARAAHRSGKPPRSVRCFSVAGVPDPSDVCWPMRPFHALLDDLEGPNDGLVSAESALGFGTPLPLWPVDHLRQMNWLPTTNGPSSAEAVERLYGSILDNLALHGFAAELKDDPLATTPASREDRRIFGGPFTFALALALALRRLEGAVQEDGDGHVAEHVRGRAAAVEEPVDGQEHRDLVGRQSHGGEDQRQGDETPRRDPPCPDAGDERG
jgi:triacylglycerol lipase